MKTEERELFNDLESAVKVCLKRIETSENKVETLEDALVKLVEWYGEREGEDDVLRGPSHQTPELALAMSALVKIGSVKFLRVAKW